MSVFQCSTRRRYRGGKSGAQSAEDMQMQMVHLLPAVRPGIEQRLETAAAVLVAATVLLRQFGCKQHHLAQQSGMFLGAVGQRGNMLLRHDQEMHRRLWMDVMEGNHVR